MKESLEGEIMRLWSSGSIFDKLDILNEGLLIWEKSIKRKRNGLKQELTNHLEELLCRD